MRAQTKARFRDMEDGETGGFGAAFFGNFYDSEVQNLYVTRDLIGGLQDYFDQHGETISEWSKEMSRLVLGLVPLTEENSFQWSEMLFPPKPKRMQAPDPMGFRQGVIERSSADDVDLIQYLEFSDERLSGLPNLVEQAYYGAIHHHMDTVMFRRQSQFQRNRAASLRQRHSRLPHGIVFFSPTKEQQDFWSLELRKARWNDVPRIYVGDIWDYRGWIASTDFLEQMDRARISLLLPKEEGLRTRIETLSIVASEMDMSGFATSMLLIRPLITLPGDHLTVKVADLRVAEKGNETDLGNVFPYYPRVMAMDDEALGEEARIFAEKFPFLSDEKDRMTYTVKRGDPVELDITGLDEGDIRVLFYSFPRISGK
jgi:hypothetical protein